MTDSIPTPTPSQPPANLAVGNIAAAASLWSLGDDDAIASARDDAFGRAPFARHLVDVIRNAPAEASFRIGLFGEWGEGKTSVMAMAEDFLIAQDIVCGHITTWSANGPRDILHAVASELARAVGVEGMHQHTAKLTKAAASRSKDVREGLADANGWFKAANALFGDAIDERANQAAAAAAEALLTDSLEKLAGRRVVIFVDDLDRVMPAALPGILMMLREAIPVRGLCFVLALSLNAVKDALEKSGYGLEEPARFLEKIIEYPAYLPDIPRERIVGYAIDQIQRIEGLRMPEVLRDLAPHLPTNPRRLKRFLRMLSSMRATVARFDDAEVSWHALYLSQLLLCEYPMEARALRADRETLLAMNHGWADFTKAFDAAKDEHKSDRPEAVHAPAAHQDRARFLELCDLIRERHSLVARWSLEEVMLLELVQPAMTQREARMLAEGVLGEAPDELIVRLRDGLDAQGVLSPEKTAVLWEFLVSSRQEHVHWSYFATRVDEQATAARMVEQTTSVLETFVKGLSVFRDGVLRGSALQAFREHLGQWATWRGTEDRVATRDRELDLYKACLDGAPVELAEAAYFDLTHLVRWSRVDELPAETAAALDAIRLHAERQIVAEVLARLLRPEGMNVYGHADWNQYGKMLLLSSESAMYDPDGLADLEKLADRAAAGDDSIQLNFLTMLVIFQSALRGSASTVPSHNVMELLAKPAVRALYWRGASTIPKSDAAARYLRYARAEILARIPVAAAELPIPTWWPSEIMILAQKDDEARVQRVASAASVQQDVVTDGELEEAEEAPDRDDERAGEQADGTAKVTPSGGVAQG